MPLRAVSPTLLAEFQSHASSSIVSALFMRSDGLQIGLTLYSESFVLSGVTYTPISSIDSSSIKVYSSTSPGNVELNGLLSTDTLEEADFVAGLWNNATIEIFRCAYTNLAAGKMTLFYGDIVEIDLSDGIVHLEVMDLTNRMKQVRGDKTSLTCRVQQFCDNQCKLSLAAHTTASSVNAVVDDLNINFNNTKPTGNYNSGWLTFTSGANAGFAREIKNHVKTGSIANITLKDAFPYTVIAADNANLVDGCDHEFSTCKAYGNAINFRGEPHIPGNDFLTVYGRQPT